MSINIKILVVRDAENGTKDGVAQGNMLNFYIFTIVLLLIFSYLLSLSLSLYIYIYEEINS
jgi:hypothetical protein